MGLRRRRHRGRLRGTTVRRLLRAHVDADEHLAHLPRGAVPEADLLLLQARTSLVSAQADAAIAQYQLLRSLGEIKL